VSEDPNKRISEIFFPFACERALEIEKRRTKFVHYTSASTGINIITKKKVWMRNALLMNDFQEIDHGQKCVKGAWHDEIVGVRMKAALYRIDQGIWQRVCELYDETDFYQRTSSYLISVSEHGGSSVDEDKYGRLSMWRAYGGSPNVALVLDSKPFRSESSALDAFSSPVLYADEASFKTEFMRVVENVEQNLEFLSELNAESVASSLFNALLFASLSTKHPGFSEEREWRVVHSPRLHPNDRMKFDLETVEGVPQKVYKLPLVNVPEEGLANIEVSELLSEVIIGPTEYPLPVYEAYASALESAGVLDVEKKIRISGIPLRKP
jgi:hypothetical protein